MSYALLNVEFVNACRFRVFQCHFSVSRLHSRVFSHSSVDTDEQNSWKLPAFLQNIQNVVTNSSCWQCLYALIRYFISSYYSTRCWNLSLYYIRCINRICKEVLYETFSISFHFHKIVHENTSALTPLCFIWVSRAIAKHALIVLTAFCQCSSFTVNGITEIYSNI